jgi:hypothetical protein
MKIKQINKSDQTKYCPLAMGSNRGKRRHFPANGAEGGEFELRGVLIVIVVAGDCRRLLDTLFTAAAAALHEGPAEGFAEAEKEHGGDTGLKEKKELADDVKEVHCLL